MKYGKKKTILSAVITIFLLILIVFIIKISIDESNRCEQEGLQYYGDEDHDINAPLPYRTKMEEIKYPGETHNNDDKRFNSLLFNEDSKRMHFSDEQIMKDLKYFNNSSNLLLEHYLNDNVPDSVTINVQDLNGNIKLSENDISSADYYTNINFKSETINKTVPNLYKSTTDRPIITKEKTYIYRFSDNYDSQSNNPPTNGMYLIKNVTKIDDSVEEDNIYNYDYDLSGINYDNVYEQLTKYDESLFNNEISMVKPGKYSSHYFESNYSDLSDNVTKDFKYFYSTAPTIAGYGLFNKR